MQLVAGLECTSPGVDIQIGVGVVLSVNSVRDSAVWICGCWRA